MYKKSSDVTLMKDDDKYYVLSEDGVFEINEVGARILYLCDGTNTIDRIVEKISTHFNASEQVVKEDVYSYTEALSKANIIIR